MGHALILAEELTSGQTLLIAGVPATITGLFAILVVYAQGRRNGKKVEQVSSHVGVSNGHGTIADMVTSTLITVGEIKTDLDAVKADVVDIKSTCPYMMPSHVPLPRRT